MPRPSARDQLFEAALKYFHSQGYKGTTIEDIAEAAGVFKGSFYNHFPSKEALAIEVLDRYENATTAQVALKGPPSAYRRLKKHFEFLLERSKMADYKHGCLMSNFSVEVSQLSKPLRAAVQKAFERWFAALAVVIRQAQAEGDIDPDLDADQLARFLGNSFEGATNYSKVVLSRQPLDDFFTMTFPKKKRKD
jgi:TetR/AcrR family transcriptional regulator, transcriptional repressor for nem operon